MGFGPKVRERRTALGFSQEHLAHQAGLSWAAVQRLEAGTIVDPHYSTLHSIAHALGTTVAELVGEKELAVPLADASETGPKLAEVVTAPEVLLEGLHNQGIRAGLAEAETLGQWLHEQVAWHYNEKYDEVLIFPTRLTPELFPSVLELLVEHEHQLEILHIVIEGGYIEAGLRQHE